LSSKAAGIENSSSNINNSNSGEKPRSLGQSDNYNCYPTGNARFDVMACSVISTFGDDECQPGPISGMWPTGETDAAGNELCAISTVIEVPCEAAPSKPSEPPSRYAHFGSYRSVEGRCDDMPDTDLVPETFIFGVMKKRWNVWAEVEFPASSASGKMECNLAVDGEDCSRCQVCRNDVGKYGLRATCDRSTGEATNAFADRECIPLSRIANGP